MCYDISYNITIESMQDYFGDLIFDDPQFEIDFAPMDHMQGVALFPKMPIIYQSRDDNRLHVKLMEWGVIPFYSKTEPTLVNRNKWLNIRSERVLDDKASYWYKIRNRRCIIPLSVTFEHRAIVGWKKKVPYVVKPKNEKVFGVPGLYSVVELPDKETGELIMRWTFGMITRKANELMRNIHNDGENRHRMPLFLPKDLLMEFVSNDLSEQRHAAILNFEIQSEELEHWPVWTIRTGKSRPDGGCKTDYFEWEKLPPLGEGNPPEEIIDVVG